jgi:membrane protein DedA with SNARE-associated domain
VHHLVVSYGYWAVALLVAAECLGIPVPGETILIVAATYAGDTHSLSVWGLFAVAAASAFMGANAGYLIGRGFGYRVAVRWGRYIRLTEARIKVGRYLFDRRGGLVVFFGRFVSVLRAYVSFLAGTSRMGARKFVVANGVGAIVWAAIYSFVAYSVGDELSRLSTPINVGLGVVAVAVIVVVLLVVRRHTDRLVDRAEAAYPGPL